MNIKKIVSVVITLILSIPFLFSCGKNTDSVMKIAGYDVPEHVYRYVVINSRADVEDTYGEDVWSTDRADEAKTALAEKIKAVLANMYTICALGNEFDLAWDGDQVASQFNLKRHEILEGYEDEDAFEADLKSLGMTEDTFTFVLSNEILSGEVYSAIANSNDDYTDEKYLSELFSGDKFIRVKQILLGKDSGSDDAARLKKATAIKARLDAGEDFDTLCYEYNNDLFMFSNPDGYYIMRGTRDLAFEDAAFSLDIGETSDIVKTEAGYSIIKRYEKEDAYIEENFDALADEFYETLYTEKYEELYASVYESITSLPEDYDITTLE